jgi:hypothetical protein
MLLDDVNDALIESVFQGEIDAFFHMRDDDQRAHRRREVIVRIAFKAHVLSEVFRLHQLAHVMKISADAAKSGVCANRFRRSFGEIGDHQAVMIGPRRFDGHTAQ